MSGKGSDRCPRDPNYCSYEEFEKRWNMIFSDKKYIEKRSLKKEDGNEA